jgi:hypothetical protein
MNHTQILPFFKAKNHNKINFLSTYVKIDSSNNESFNMNQQEAMSVARAKDALTIISPKESLQALANFETLKVALKLYFQRNNTEESSENIKTIPTFCKPQIEREVLSNEVKDTFARIGERVRKEFIEEQIARADQYNIPYNAYTVNFLELSYKIDEYEELLRKAKDYCLNWDIAEYDPVALHQEIEEQERRASYENDDLYAYFVHSRGLEA